MTSPAFVVLLPVKPPARGKSRLDVDPVRRRRLAAAFALDTARACLSAASVVAVLAVTDDARFAADLRAAGCETIPDGVADDLNESLRQAAAEAARRWPGTVPVALCADLPALSAADLDDGSRRGSRGHPVRRSSRTATVSAPRSTPRRTTCSHPRSATARAPRTSAPVRSRSTESLDTLRQDVDDSAALAAAEVLGLGAHTRLALA